MLTLGQILGTLIAGAIYQLFSWPFVFIGIGALMSLGLIGQMAFIEGGAGTGTWAPHVPAAKEGVPVSSRFDAKQDDAAFVARKRADVEPISETFRSIPSIFSTASG